jgi:hypothetical protein
MLRDSFLPCWPRYSLIYQIETEAGQRCVAVWGAHEGAQIRWAMMIACSCMHWPLANVGNCAHAGGRAASVGQLATLRAYYVYVQACNRVELRVTTSMKITFNEIPFKFTEFQWFRKTLTYFIEKEDTELMKFLSKYFISAVHKISKFE